MNLQHIPHPTPKGIIELKRLNAMKKTFVHCGEKNPAINRQLIDEMFKDAKPLIDDNLPF